MEKVKFLSEENIKRMSEFENEFLILDKDIQISQLKVKIAEKELALYSANFTLKSKDKDELYREYVSITGKKKELFKCKIEYIKKITDELELPNKWGFEPLTGEIKID